MAMQAFVEPVLHTVAARTPPRLGATAAASTPTMTPSLQAPLGTLGRAAIMAAVPIAALASRRRRGRGARRSVPAVVMQAAPGLKEAVKGLDTDDFPDICDQTGITLNRYTIELQKRGIIDEDVNLIMNSIREGCKVIANLVRRAPLKQADLLGLEGNVNVQGEDQKKLDVITNEVLKNALKYTGKLGTLASEEEDAPVSITDTELDDEFSSRLVGEAGNYICVFDPLDGSSNVDAGVPVGTIFGVFKESDESDVCEIGDSENLTQEEIACLTQTLQPGKNLVVAGYCFYSMATELVVTFGRGVVGFTLDNEIGEFKVTRPSIKIPERGSIYSCNEANFSAWDKPMQDYISALQEGKGETGKSYTMRYIGSMVGDVHRTLLYGGVFAYPADTKNPDGKLRLLYEGAPMSFLIEQAGGKSITGHSRVMEIPPANVHQRVPVILGSPDDVDECFRYYDKSDDPELRARCDRRMKGEL